MRYKMAFMTFRVLTMQKSYYLTNFINYASQSVNYYLVDTINLITCTVLVDRAFRSATP